MKNTSFLATVPKCLTPTVIQIFKGKQRLNPTPSLAAKTPFLKGHRLLKGVRNFRTGIKPQVALV